VYTAFPYYHGVSQYMAVLPALIAGASAVIAEKFSASRFWDEIRTYRATVCWSVMTIPAALMKQPEKPDDADNPLRIVFGMGIDPNIWEAFERRFAVTFVNSFGSTETNLIIACPPATPVPNRLTSGRATDAFEVAIADENDNLLPVGTTGYIVSRPRLPAIQMQGYFRMPEETLKATTNLWMHNGDMGYVDQDGWFYFTGRGKDAMRIGGENVSAQEIETILQTHPAVLESAVFAVPGELGEDEIKADICLKSDASVTAADIIAFCRKHMSKYMVPRYVQFRAQLPKTGTEKIQKAKLKQEGLTAESWDSRRNT
jgi:crotonobetaine/carnitine-CoA ligase